MFRRFAPWILSASLIMPAVVAAADSPPNVVIIFMDDMGYADVSCFGAEGYTTPNIDRLAEEGRKFTNFHVNQPVCSASRCGLLTGCYSNRIGIHGALGPGASTALHPDEMTIADLLKQKGYATGMSGKWHLGDVPGFLPTDQGFDEYYGLPYSNDMWPFHPTAKHFPKLPMYEGAKVVDEEVTPEEQKVLTRDYTQRAVDFIDRNKDQPFFFYLAHSMVHVPLFVTDEFEGKSGAGLYADTMLEVDWSVGQVMEALERNGIAENTWIIFTSDNGPWLSYGDHAGSSGPYREGKGTSWEGGTRVTGIMRWPARIPAGTTSDAMAMTIDLLPTIAAVADAPLPEKKIDGLNILPLITGKEGATNPHDGYAFYYKKNELQAVTTGDGRWKLVFPHTYRTLSGREGGTGGTPVKYDNLKLEAPELYNLYTDPTESKNVINDFPEEKAKLMAYAETIRTELGDGLRKKPTGSGTREAGKTKP
jgi:arylsulfatase